MSVDKLLQWQAEFKADPTANLAASSLRRHDAHDVLIDRDVFIEDSVNLFSNTIETEGLPITNQKSSGRCWLFAATNVLRIDIIKKYKLKEFQLSQSFLFFFDKLEKSNFFLEQIIDTYKEDVDSRLVQHLLSDPIGDGGQFDMFANIIEKYGIVPYNVFPDSFNTTSSYRMRFMITTKLREFAQILREKLQQGKFDEIQSLKEQQQKEIHRLLILFMGTPPGPNDEFLWEYQDSDKKYHRLKTTPFKFYKDIVKYDCDKAISLLNDPRNVYNQTIEIERLGNVYGSKIVKYLNVDASILAKIAVDRIKNNKPVFFGSHTPIYVDKKSGIMDTNLWQYKLIGYDPKQNKSDRLTYHQSLMTHAMVFVGVNLDDEGNPTRWKVENSWGKDSGLNGYYVLTQDYFDEYVYQIVADREEIEKFDLEKYLDTKPIVLPPWDPCGALAVFKNDTEF